MRHWFTKNEEIKLHQLFEFALVAKGLHAILEIIGGVMIFFVSRSFLSNLLFYISQENIFNNPDNFIFKNIILFLENFTPSTQHFVAFYLLAHGVVKIGVVWGLLKEKIWAYPTAIILFSLFAIYEITRFSYTPSPMLALVTFMDLLVVILTLHEYNHKKKMIQGL